MSSSPATAVLTKEQLKNALVQRGVPIPPASARKEEFQKLYDEKVLPHQTRSEFSSDDEQDSTSNGGDVSSVPRGHEKTKEDNGLWISQIREFTDAELYTALKKLGAEIGPVVESTRGLYEQQLLNLMSNPRKASSPSASSNGHHSESKDASNGNGFSDSDDELAVETASRASNISSRGSISPKKRVGRPAGSPKPAGTTSAASVDVDNIRNKTPPPQKRVQRRSETPKTPVRRPEPMNPVDSRISEREEESQYLDGPKYNASTPSRTGKRTAETTSGVSFFKERPGYASTTTSNVLPLKPTANLYAYNKDDSINQKKISSDAGGSKSSWLIAVVVLCIAIAIMVAFYIFTPGATEDGVPVDELDEILDDMDKAQQ